MMWLSLLATAGIAAQAQDSVQTQEPGARRFTLLNGTRVVFSPHVDPGDASNRLSSRVQLSDINAIHRVLLDEERGVYFGYTVRVEPIANSNRFRLTFTPLAQEKARELTNSTEIRQLDKTFIAGHSTIRDSNTTKVEDKTPEGPRYPGPQIIEDGDTIALDVLVNPKTGVKFADRITVSSQELSQSDGSDRKQQARDFSLNDVELKVSDYQLLVNGKQLTSKITQSGVAGPLIWVYIPGHGRFAFSIKPLPEHNFEKVGLVEENKIVFTIKGERFEWRSKEPILGIAGGGGFNVYVRHDPHFKPKFAMGGRQTADQNKVQIDDDCCLIGAADSIEALLLGSPETKTSSGKKDE